MTQGGRGVLWGPQQYTLADRAGPQPTLALIADVPVLLVSCLS